MCYECSIVLHWKKRILSIYLRPCTYMYILIYNSICFYVVMVTGGSHDWLISDQPILVPISSTLHFSCSLPSQSEIRGKRWKSLTMCTFCGSSPRSAQGPRTPNSASCLEKKTRKRLFAVCSPPLTENMMFPKLTNMLRGRLSMPHSCFATHIHVSRAGRGQTTRSLRWAEGASFSIQVSLSSADWERRLALPHKTLRAHFFILLFAHKIPQKAAGKWFLTGCDGTISAVSLTSTAL